MRSVGKLLRGLELKPVIYLQNMHHFLMLIGGLMDSTIRLVGHDQLTDIGINIRSFVYEYPSEMIELHEARNTYLFRSNILELRLLKRFMDKLRLLHTLKLTGFFVDELNEAAHLLDTIAESSGHTMKTLVLVNLTYLPCPLRQIKLFQNLNVSENYLNFRPIIICSLNCFLTFILIINLLIIIVTYY